MSQEANENMSDLGLIGKKQASSIFFTCYKCILFKLFVMIISKLSRLIYYRVYRIEEAKVRTFTDF